MLRSIESQHFQALLKHTTQLHLPDGQVLEVRVESVSENPRGRIPENPRMPFSVALTSLAPSDFVHGLCAIELADHGRLEGVFVSRVPALGRNPELAYLDVVFN